MLDAAFVATTGTPPIPTARVIPTPAAATFPRPGDVVLARVIKWWDSGQIQRAGVGVAMTAGPIIYDLFQKNELTWRTAVNAIVVGIFAWMGWSRLKSPDIATGTGVLDAPAHPVNVTAFAPAQLMADLQAREGAKVAPPKGDPK
jgi:hypothetical protein